MNGLAFIASPLRATAGAQGARQPAAHHGIRGTLTPFDGGLQGQGALCRVLFRKIAQRLARRLEIFGGQVQLRQQQPRLLMVRLLSCQRGKTFQPLLRGFIRSNLGKGGGKIGVRLRIPCGLQNPRSIFRIALLDVTSRCHRCGGNQVWRLPVGGNRRFACLDRVAIVKHRLGLLQRQHGIAAAVNVAGQAATACLGGQRGTRPFPV